MSQTTIPLQFEQYLLDKITAGAAPNLDEFVFAYIPNLDPEQPIDRATGLPDESFIVHRQNVDQTARLNRNTLIYSVIVPSHVAPFTFNAMYLHDKNVPESCGLIVHKTDETKESGMATTKSVAQEYDGAAEIAGIHIDPATWQIDYHARLFGIDEEIRLTQLDKYGHTAFISGFNVVKLSSNDYRIDPGIVYVGGLRCELKTAVTRTVTAKPNGLYVDVVREGSTLSKWINVPTIRVSNTPLSDYVDEQGYQHYVTRLAGVDASGNVQDWREWDIVSQAEAEAGTATKARKWTAQRVRQAIVAWWDSIPKGTAFNKNFGSSSGTVCQGNDSRLSNAREWTADVVSQAEAQAGTATTARKWTAQRVRQAIVAWWDSIPKGTAFNKNFGSAAGTVCQGDDSRLSNAREWTADVVLQAEAQAGTATTARKWTAQRVRQAIVAWWDSIPKGTAFNKNFGSAAGTVCQGNDSRLSNAREWTAEVVSQTEAEEGTATTARKWTAQRVRQSVAKVAVMLSGNQTISGIKTFADKLITSGTVAIRASANDFALYINSNGLSTEATQVIGTDQKNGTWRLGTPLPDSVAFGCNSNQRILFGVYDPASGQFTSRAGVRQGGQFQTKVAGESSQVMDSFSCRAWVNFDGTAAPVIRGSANISSVVKTSLGSFALNLATPMPDENYAVIYTTGIDNQPANAASVDNAGNLTASSFKLFSRTVSAEESGRPNNFVAIYR